MSLVLGAGPARATTFYLAASSGADVGVDGTTNLPNGGSVVVPRALLTATPPSGATTWASTGTLEGGPGAIGRFYGPTYASITDLAAGATATLHVSSTYPLDDWECGGFTPDTFIVRLFDHDPAGLPQNGVQLGTASTASPGSLGGVITVSLGNAAHRIQPGHRLVLTVDLWSNGDSYCTGGGGVALNSASAPSSLTLEETTVCTPTGTLSIPGGQRASGTPLAPTALFGATNVAGPTCRFGGPQSDRFATWDVAKWTKTDVGGDVAAAPTARFDRLTVRAKGAGIRGTADQFTFLSQPATFAGDFTLDVQVPALGSGGDAALEQVGLMVRQDVTAGAANVAMLVTNGAGARFQHRATAGGATAVATLAGPRAPQWLRLARSGGTFTGYASADGVTWTVVGSQAVAMTGTFRIGLAASSYQVGTTILAQFSRFLVSDPALSIEASWRDPSVPQPSLDWPRATYWLAVSGADAACPLPAWAMGSFDFSLAVTTLGDHLTSGPPDVPQACPSLGATDPLVEADRFTLVTSAFTDSVTSLTVAVTGPAAVQKLYVTSADGATVYGELASPPATATVPLSPPIPVTTSIAQLRLAIRPATYAALASGTQTPVAARVTAVAARNDTILGDATSASIVVDRKPPALPIWGSTSLGMNEVSLAWSNPALDFDRVVLLRSAPGATVQNTTLSPGAAYAQGASYGTDVAAYVGPAAAATDVLEGGFPYYYRLFAGDACRNWSGGIPQGPVTPLTSPPPTTVGALAATLGLCAEVSLVANFTNDGNRNNSVTFSRAAAPGGPFGDVACVPERSFRRWSCTDVTPAAGGSWYYRATFRDDDGFEPAGQSVATTGRISVARCPPGAGTLELTALPSPPDVTVGPGDATVPAARFRLFVANSTVDVVDIALANLAPSPVLAADFSEVRLWEDLGTVGAWDAADRPVAVASFSAARNAWIVSGFTVIAGRHDYLLTVSVRYGADGSAGRAFRPTFQTSSITVGPLATRLGSQTVTGATVTVSGALRVAPVGDPTPGTARPTVVIVNPDHGAVSPDGDGRIRVQAQVWDPGGVGVTSVMLSHDGGAAGTFTTALAPNGRYVLRGGATLYEALVQLETGGHGLQVRATNANGELSTSSPVFVTATTAGGGDGRLLVRESSSQLCNDCHALPTHSSQSSGDPRRGASRHGAWAAACRDCHTPHGTRNVALLKETIVPPPYAGYQPARRVTFLDARTGDSGASPLVSHVTGDAALQAAGTLGPCQVCHTRTSSPDGVPRWRSTGNADDHFTSGEATRCTTCHSHQVGFGVVESKGAQPCGGCHGGKLAGMQAGAKRSAHALGPAGGGLQDALTWGEPLVGGATAPAARSCIGMCHADHVHNDPATFPAEVHASNLHRDATSPATRALARDGDPGSATFGLATPASPGAGTTRSDHVAGQAQGCISCHQRALDSARPALSGAAYDASAHGTSTAGGVQWEYVQHDDRRDGVAVSRFERNCTKCHAGRAAEASTPSWAGGVQGVHWSENPALLGGALNPAGVPATNACYACHGGGAVGRDLSNGKDVAAATAHATRPGGSGHPSDSVAATQHDTHAEAAMSFGDPFAGEARHAGCVDCHDPHRAKAGRHATPGSAAGPALEGAPGAKLSTNPAPWAVPTVANFSVVKIQAGVDAEATLCFRCHSSFAWGTGAKPTSPSLGLAYTDQAREFNPANAGFHPVLADCSNNPGRIDLRNLTRGGWSQTVRNRMTCTDCHSAIEPGAQGPHGSATKFILKGPSTRWDASVTVGDTNVFCFNCHDPGFAYSRASVHTDYDPRAYFSGHHFTCQTCHAAVPHGGPRPGMLVDGVTQGIQGWDDSAPYNGGSALKITSYPPPGGGWSWGNCACGGDDHTM